MLRPLLTAILVQAVGLSAGADNLVVNGGFDELDGDGLPVGWKRTSSVFRYVDGVGRRRSRALVIDRSDADHYDFPSQRLSIEGGRRYRLSGWIRTENVVGTGGGARIGVDCSAEVGGWDCGLYSPGVVGTSDGWRHVACDIDIPKDDDTFAFVVFLAKGMTGTAYFDDLSVTPVVQPLVRAFVSDAYRNRASEGEVTFSVSLRADDAACRVREVGVRFRLPNGACGWNETAVAPTDGVARVTVPVSSLPMGPHPVQVQVTSNDADGGEEFSELLFERLETLPEKGVRLDAQGRTLVDGRPFFPLGMYGYANDAFFADLGASPFNCVMMYDVAERRNFDACQRQGLRVIGCIKDAFAGSSWAPAAIHAVEDESAYVADKVVPVRDHPALLAWYACDELGPDWADRLRARRDYLHRLDPDHPVWTVQYQIDDYGEYVGSYDIAGTDPYPIGRKPEGDDLAMPGKWTRNVRQTALGTHAIWQVAQFFDTSVYGKYDYETSAPTEEELSCMVWQCIAEGANGIVVYAYHPLKTNDAKEPFARKWAEACRVAQAVRDRFDVLLSDDITREVTVHEATADVSVRAWDCGETLQALVVNGGRTAGRAVFSARGRRREVELAPLGHEMVEISLRPSVTDVTVRADADPATVVTVGYTLRDAPAVVTVDLQTNSPAGWASVGGAATGELRGDAQVVVREFDCEHVVRWFPPVALNGIVLEPGTFRAVVKAWPTNAPPDYLTVDLRDDAVVSTFTNRLRYYESAAQLPGGFTNALYRSDVLVMRKIPAANVVWLSGSPRTQAENPGTDLAFRAMLTDDYYMGVYPVTQGQYRRFAGSLELCSFTDLPQSPRMAFNNVRMSTLRGQSFVEDPADKTLCSANGCYWPRDGHRVAPESAIGRLRALCGIADIDLPTAAQWEYAARGGVSTSLPNGVDAVTPDTVGEVGWLDSPATGYEVGEKPANGFGLYDVLGTVTEACLDRSRGVAEDLIASLEPGWEPDADGNYANSAVTVNPTGPKNALIKNQVFCGGGWAEGCSAMRLGRRSAQGVEYTDTRSGHGGYKGFRLCCSIKETVK